MTHRTPWLASALFLVAAACDQAPSPTPASTATAASAPAAAAVPSAPTPSAAPAAADSAPPAARPRRERGGVAGTLLAAAAELGLPAEKQKTVDELEQALGDPKPADAEARMGLDAALRDGVKAGKVELVKLEPSLAELDKAAAARKEAEIKALDGLHKALDATERKALVEAVRKRQADREARFGKRPDADDTANDPARTRRRLERLAGELGLDAEQQKKAEPIVEKYDFGREGPGPGALRDEMKKRLDALLAAFGKDAFRAAQLDFGADAKRYRDATKKKVEYLNALLGVIKPEQRDKLAASVQAAGRGRPGRGMRGPGGPMRMPLGGPPGVGAIGDQLD